MIASSNISDPLKDQTFIELEKELKETTNLQCDDETPIAALPQINPSAYFGILNKFIEISASNSEAPGMAVATNILARICAMLDRRVYQRIGDSTIHCRPFFLIVGKSGKARKGTAEALPNRVFERVEELLEKQNPDHQRLNIHSGGLASGEGFGFAIRDASDEDKDPGIKDKRLLVIESEFANVLANCKRENSTLSPTIRNIFDGRDIAPLTKKNRFKVTKPHVVIVDISLVMN